MIPRHVNLIFVMACLVLAGCGGGGARDIGISPSAVTLRPGGMASFEATSKVDTDSTYFQWSASGGTFSTSIDHSSIHYVAGIVEGTYTVSVIDTKTGASDTASVTIRR